VSDRLVRACSELPKLCEFFHIPFQSGDDDILREMKRGYTAARYTSIIDNVRRYMPDASISGDAIVGFPGKESITEVWGEVAAFSGLKGCSTILVTRTPSLPGGIAHS